MCTSVICAIRKDFFEVDTSAKALNLGIVIALAIKPKDLNIEDRLFILRDLNLYKFLNQILTNDRLKFKKML